MAVDTLRTDSPAAKAEVEVLKHMAIGDTRLSALFPGLPEDIVWTLVERRVGKWEFEGVWCDVPLMTVVIHEDGELLVLNVKGGA